MRDEERQGVDTAPSTAWRRAMMSAMQEGVLWQDPGGAVLECNAEAERLLGLTADQLQQRAPVPPGWRATDEAGAPLPAEAWPGMAVGRTGQASRGVVVGIHLPSERVRWLRLNSEPLRDGQGRLTAVLTTVLDVTEQHGSLPGLGRDFETFLSQTTDFIYFKDRQSRFRFCSQTLADITHHAHWRDLLGKHDREVFPPDLARIYEEEEGPVLERGEPLLGRVDPFEDAQGRRGFVQTSKWPVRNEDGEVVGIFGISRDITRQKAAEESLREALAENERIVAELRAAAANVKVLSGLLPICSFCKKIRNDTGYWDQLEQYIAQHSEAVFSHGFCPDCGRKHYPEYFK